MTTAVSVLEAAQAHMTDRASTYDKPTGERSMSATVKAFASVSGVTMTEEQGWLFMGLLKMVRSQQGDYKLDNYEDEAAYAALRAECAAIEREKPSTKPLEAGKESAIQKAIRSGDIFKINEEMKKKSWCDRCVSWHTPGNHLVDLR